MGAAASENGKSGLTLWHAFWVYTSPRSLFTRVEDTGAYGWALVVMLGLVMLMGYALMQSGLIDREVDQRTEKRLAELEAAQGILVDRIELRDQMDDIRKQGDFEKTITKLGAVVLNPLYLLASFLLISSVCYALVALTGRKPEWHTLMSICVYAGFIELVAYGVRLAMMFYYKTLDADTSLAMLRPIGEGTPLAAIDPFRMWFWCLAAIGLTVTQQLSRRMAIAGCIGMCLIAMGVRAAMTQMSGMMG